uniref:Splicing factor 3B subunit 2 n=1 Tax=Loa loa TaxID=7209 RepID=A0A1I7VPZ0_LOALO
MDDSPEPETDATLSLPKKKPGDKGQEEPDEICETSFTVPELLTENGPENNETVPRKRRPKEKKKKPKLQWIPPPRPPPEPYEMPPEEKKLADILKEEKIPPTKRYARRPQHLDVFIPFEIPWENLPALQTQEGMGAFGHTRDANIKVDQVLSIWYRYATRTKDLQKLFENIIRKW